MIVSFFLFRLWVDNLFCLFAFWFSVSKLAAYCCEGHLTINGAVLRPDHLPVRQRCLVWWEIQVNIKGRCCSRQGGSIVFQIKSHITPWKQRGRTVKHLCKRNFFWFYKRCNVGRISPVQQFRNLGSPSFHTGYIRVFHER